MSRKTSIRRAQRVLLSYHKHHQYLYLYHTTYARFCQYLNNSPPIRFFILFLFPLS